MYSCSNRYQDFSKLLTGKFLRMVRPAHGLHVIIIFNQSIDADARSPELEVLDLID